jgi:hypothetical protein
LAFGWEPSRADCPSASAKAHTEPILAGNRSSRPSGVRTLEIPGYVRLEPLRAQPFLPACRFRLVEGAGFADRLGTTFFDAAFLFESAAVFFFAATFLDLEAFAFGADFDVLPSAALEEAFAPFGVLRIGIISPTACMALDPALITTSAADVAASPIRSSTPLDFFLLGIRRSLRD